MKTKDIALTALFAALTAVFAQLAFPIPMTPIIFSMGILAVFLTGALLPKKYAFIAQLVYLLLGAVGVPVFGNFSGGFATLIGPTGGYLMAYPVMALLIAWILEHIKKKTPITYILAVLPSMVPCYLFGSLWYMYVGHVSWAKSLMLTVLPFIAVDMTKVVISGFLAYGIAHALSKSHLKSATEN